LIQELPAPVFFQQEGSLLLWHRQDALQAKTLVDKLYVNSKQLPDACTPVSLNADQLMELEPELGGKFQQGLLLPREGPANIDLYPQLYDVVIGAAQVMGVVARTSFASLLEQAGAIDRGTGTHG
jgi:glycine oxidase